MASTRLLTVTQVAEELQLARSRVYVLLSTRAIQSVKIGKARRIPVAALEEYIERLRQDAQQAAS